MPRPSKYEKVQCRYFAWRIMQKGFNVWYGDGRSKGMPLGRHSLGTKDRQEAIQNLHLLDAKMAVKHNLANPSILEDSVEGLLTIRDGARLYLKHCSRPAITRGAKPKTVQRYKAVLDRFTAFAEGEGVTSWRWVNQPLIENYASWLEDNNYKYRTEYLELTCLKQVMKWLIEQKLIPPHCQIKLSLSKANTSPTYAYSAEEVVAIVRFCMADVALEWMGRVLCTLSFTGMRIGEAAQLEWRDIDLDERFIHVRDETRGASPADLEKACSTKNGSTRHIPMHRELHALFSGMKGLKEGPVFHGPRGGRLKPDVVRTVLKRDVLPEVAKRLYPAVAAPAMLRGRVHSFRHSFATAAYRAGWPERTILDIMGHSSSTITRLYRHLSKDEHLEAMEMLPPIEAACPDQTDAKSPHDVQEPGMDSNASEESEAPMIPEVPEDPQDPEDPNAVAA